ncbi:hypothetical protein GCM10012275_05270 [Longimycelium tulufanense]|uniref:Iron-binding zinc finger CDGSH type domain-containing protein n=1 Tax=Longimycelium tulufanense TaxID=907463 RepID=A0A8J3C651_9PSEU|nr:CDGSH iron-sulfur domain-containing protein [Longimycelium tulufanense]GGM37082.1 hypothetical protein GCM10012275_05270 [Longimycelium tulufanense]
MTARHRGRGGNPITVTLCENGPLLLRGDFVIQTQDGRQIAVRRRTVALCRCGHSTVGPFCDGTHKLVRRRDRPSTAAGSGTGTDPAGTSVDTEEER